ncbi:MAG: YicC family protein [Candidatus Omnitrophica bacterium]|nr:YicC family protein [Candidatus Omnitrophota bacterium]
MIRSMTGFGKGTETSPYGKITVQIKTLNYKSLSISCNPFNGFFFLEEKIKKACEGNVYRGKVFVKITNEPTSRSQSMSSVTVNEKIARQYQAGIRKAAKTLNVPGELDIKTLISLPDVLEHSTTVNGKELWNSTEKALGKAFRQLTRYRKAEGRILEKDLKARLRDIQKHIRQIKKHEKQCVRAYRKKLKDNMENILGSRPTDRNRLEEEVAQFARNCDVAEETTRLSGHIDAFTETIRKAKQDTGKKLDFIAQEMQREANTIGSKSADLRISRSVISVKSEIEKIREQIRNIE